MGSFIDLTGQRFGALKVLGLGKEYISPKGRRYLRWHCLCDCGKTCDVRPEMLKSGHTQSCGCLQKNTVSQMRKKYNDYEIQEDYVIMYTTEGDAFLVDLEDFWKVKDICWHKNDKGYFVNRDSVGIHRIIMDCPNDYDVDHKKGKLSRWDNRKENLRIATTSQNIMNRGLLSNNTSGVTGVHYSNTFNKWIAKIVVNGKTIYLGSSENKDVVIDMRKKAEEKYFGEWSYDNSQKS